MAHSITYKMPRSRKASEFTVYPFTADDTTIKLQSDNHCIIVHIDGAMKGKTVFSKRFNQYPTFAFCNPSLGGKIAETPQEIADQLEKILEAPTGKTVTLV